MREGRKDERIEAYSEKNVLSAWLRVWGRGGWNGYHQRIHQTNSDLLLQEMSQTHPAFLQEFVNKRARALFFWLLVAGCHEQFSATSRSAQFFRWKFVHFDMLTFFPKSVIIITVRRGWEKWMSFLRTSWPAAFFWFFWPASLLRCSVCNKILTWQTALPMV